MEEPPISINPQDESISVSFAVPGRQAIVAEHPLGWNYVITPWRRDIVRATGIGSINNPASSFLSSEFDLSKMRLSSMV